MSNYDVIVLGTGAMGSATCYYLSKLSNLKILGIDQFSPGHKKGSSCGRTRLFRKAYFEEEKYIPLLLEAEKLWIELEKDIERKVFHQTGLALFSQKNGKKINSILAASKKYQLNIKSLDDKKVQTSFPGIEIPTDWEAIWEPAAGYLEVENCIKSFTEKAASNGVQFQFDTKVESVSYSNGLFKLVIDNREITSKKLIVSAGGWLRSLLPDFPMPLTLQRAPQFWFKNATKTVLPCFAFDLGEQFIYGFPEDEWGVKIASYRPAENIESPDQSQKEFERDDLKWIKYCLDKFLPSMGKVPQNYQTCFYTTTDDENFIFDFYKDDFPALILGGGSGHAFKFSPIIGKLAAMKTLNLNIEFDLEFLKIRN
jgi:monomeric sarcosine oxidase